jgi:hypothetical protein
MGSLAAVGIVKGKPFNPDARMEKILTDAAAIGTAVGRTVNWNSRPSEGFYYYPNSAWYNPLFIGGYNFETPPPQVSADGVITPYASRSRPMVALTSALRDRFNRLVGDLIGSSNCCTEGHFARLHGQAIVQGFFLKERSVSLVPNAAQLADFR